MKLALASRTAERHEHRDRLRRDRALAPQLRVAFPAVQQLRLELIFQESSLNTPAAQSHLLHPPARAFFEFPCPYADCDGQFNLTHAVNAALADPAHRTQGALECTGKRARQLHSKQPCQLRVTYMVSVIYYRDT